MRVLEKTMGDHFKYGKQDLQMIGSRPLLEGKAHYTHAIERKAFEQKIIEDLKNKGGKNSTKLLHEFKDAQDAQ
jgi:hypothetical protein